MLAIDTTAKASLSSQRSMSFVASPARASVFWMASAGAMVNSAGARAAPPQATSRASTGRPSFLARSALIRTSAAAPSLMDEAFAAVTVPSFLKTGLSEAILSGRAFFGPSSSATTVFSPFFPSISTGTISFAKRPFFCASMAFWVDATANSSCAAREMPNFSAVASAQIPMWTPS
jgi:hypothetical protein